MTPVIGGRSASPPAPGAVGASRVADDDLADVADLQRGLVRAVVVGDLPAHQAGSRTRRSACSRSPSTRCGRGAPVFHGAFAGAPLGERGGGRGHRGHHRQALDQLPAVHLAGLELVQQRLDVSGSMMAVPSSTTGRSCARGVAGGVGRADAVTAWPAATSAGQSRAPQVLAVPLHRRLADAAGGGPLDGDAPPFRGEARALAIVHAGADDAAAAGPSPARDQRHRRRRGVRRQAAAGETRVRRSRSCARPAPARRRSGRRRRDRRARGRACPASARRRRRRAAAVRWPLPSLISSRSGPLSEPTTKSASPSESTSRKATMLSSSPTLCAGGHHAAVASRKRPLPSLLNTCSRRLELIVADDLAVVDRHQIEKAVAVEVHRLELVVVRVLRQRARRRR